MTRIEIDLNYPSLTPERPRDVLFKDATIATNRSQGLVNERSQEIKNPVAFMRSSGVMAGILLAENGSSMLEINKQGVSPVSVFKQGSYIDPSCVTPLITASSTNHPVNGSLLNSGTKECRPLLVEQSLERHGTLLSARGSSNNRAAELKVLLGDSSAKVKSGAMVSSKLATSRNAVAFEQGRSRVRVALDLELENNIVVEGGFLSGFVSLKIKPKRKDDLHLGHGKIRIAGFEVAPGNEDRFIFYQVTSPLHQISNDYSRLFLNGVDNEGFGSVEEGVYVLNFHLKIPIHNTGGKPRGILYNTGRSGATIKYIAIASIKIIDPQSGKRSITHFYRDIQVWPVLDPLTILTPAPDPVLARAAKKLFMGGEGTLSLTASVHRLTWPAGHPIYIRIHIVNETKKQVRSVSLGLIRTMTLFRARELARNYGSRLCENLDAYETATTEKRVAESILSAGNRGSKGYVSAKGWWTGVEEGESTTISHSLLIPHDALSIPRARLIEVDYTIRVSLNTNNITGTSEAVHVSLPIRIVNFISLDPPPSGQFLQSSNRPSSIIELDTPKQNYSESPARPTENKLSDRDSSNVRNPHKKRLDPINGNLYDGLQHHEYYNIGPYNNSEGLVSLCDNDLGGIENPLDTLRGRLSESESLLDEPCLFEPGYTGNENIDQHPPKGHDPSNYHSSSQGDHYYSQFIKETEFDDVASDEEMDRMVGFASSRCLGNYTNVQQIKAGPNIRKPHPTSASSKHSSQSNTSTPEHSRIRRVVNVTPEPTRNTTLNESSSKPHTCLSEPRAALKYTQISHYITAPKVQGPRPMVSRTYTTVPQGPSPTTSPTYSKIPLRPTKSYILESSHIRPDSTNSSTPSTASSVRARIAQLEQYHAHVHQNDLSS